MGSLAPHNNSHFKVRVRHHNGYKEGDNMGNDQDKRGLKRRHLIFYLRTFDRKTGMLVGHLVDITTHGLMLIGEKGLETRKLFTLKMATPIDFGDMEYIEFDAECIWSATDINPQFYDSGMKFKKISIKDREIIKSLVFRYGIMD